MDILEIKDLEKLAKKEFQKCFLIMLTQAHGQKQHTMKM
jgi:hypothetical protein